jgi:glycosyltransferase involved in cell wall biosynthesis
MKIVYDSQIFSEQEFGGISRYICALASQMSRLPDVDAKIVAPLHINRYLKNLNRELVIGKYLPYIPKTGLAMKALSSTLFRPITNLLKPDVIHETYYSKETLYPGKIPHVLTVYDMTHERFPQSFRLGNGIQKSKEIAINRANHIFCISENTRNDLMAIYNLSDEMVSVTYLGCDALPSSDVNAKTLVGNSPYILHVAGRHGYKNFDGLLRAYAMSAWLNKNFRLVCFGAGVFSDVEHCQIRSLGLTRDQVIQVGGDDSRLAALYKGAAVFVYPSKYEGFGIPPLEAMSLNCPVACSNASSIPEVVGDAGEYFDPDDPESIRVSVEHVLQASARRAELVQRGCERRQQFTWERCAADSLKGYQRLLA